MPRAQPGTAVSVFLRLPGRAVSLAVPLAWPSMAAGELPVKSAAMRASRRSGLDRSSMSADTQDFDKSSSGACARSRIWARLGATWNSRMLLGYALVLLVLLGGTRGYGACASMNRIHSIPKNTRRTLVERAHSLQPAAGAPKGTQRYSRVGPAATSRAARGRPPTALTACASAPSETRSSQRTLPPPTAALLLPGPIRAVAHPPPCKATAPARARSCEASATTRTRGCRRSRSSRAARRRRPRASPAAPARWSRRRRRSERTRRCAA